MFKFHDFFHYYMPKLYKKFVKLTYLKINSFLETIWNWFIIIFKLMVFFNVCYYFAFQYLNENVWYIFVWRRKSVISCWVSNFKNKRKIIIGIWWFWKYNIIFKRKYLKKLGRRIYKNINYKFHFFKKHFKCNNFKF